VGPEQLLWLADQLHKRQVLLEETLTHVAERGSPMSKLEARLIVEASAVRGVVEALRYEAVGRSFSMKVAARLPWWMKPRIGRLQHHAPRPLRVPASYLRTRAPEQAPTITIVTPSYQQGRFLDRTIYSVVSQRYPALEYVVQDGGSSDQTLEVLRRFDRVLTRWSSEADGGQADAINRGFQKTTGGLMAWLNSDDMLLPGTLAYVARFFVEHPSVDVVYGHRLLIDENDGQIGSWTLPRHDDLALTLADYVPQETLFWRRSVWEAAGGRVDPRFEYALDWDLLLRFREAGGKMVRLPRYLGAFRVHDDQKTTASHALGLEECIRLRRRVHGRDLSIGETVERLKPYFLRHMLIHARHRIVDGLPVPRIPVGTVPSETWLRAQAVEPTHSLPSSAPSVPMT
jgi:glycosyltransferase involved in cell wall biosynthesis